MISETLPSGRLIDRIALNETVSTNTDARNLVRRDSLARPLLITANRQTGGRGRQGKPFFSPDGGLYLTLAVPCGLPVTEAVGITSAAAVAVCRGIEAAAYASAPFCRIKWVNDILLSNGQTFGKAAGILVESLNDPTCTVSQFLLIGVGVNIRTAPEIRDSEIPSISLADAGSAVDRDELALTVTDALLDVCESGFSFAAFADEYRARSLLPGKSIRWTANGTAQTGTAVGIADDGALLVQTEDGRLLRLDSGEIHLRFRESAIFDNHNK